MIGIGIDLGAHGARAAAIRYKGGSLGLEAYAAVSHQELSAEGVDASSPRAVAAALLQRLAARGARARRVVVGVSGRDAITRYSQLPHMPEWRLQLLVGMEVNEVAEKTGEPLSADHRVLSSGSDGNLVLVALAKDARVQAMVEAVEGAGVEVSGAVPQPVAVADCYRVLGEDPSSKITLVVDIGHGASEVAIVEMGELIFARSVAVGASVFHERIEKLLGVDAATAIEVLESGRTPDGQDTEAMLRPARQQLASLVESSLEFARAQLKRKNLRVERLVVTGGGARIPGLLEAMGKSLSCPAEAFDPMASLDAAGADRASREDAERAGLESAAAVGLALSAVVPTATRLDLLPLRVKARLEFRHRTLWVRLAAGALAASLLVTLGAAFLARSGQSGRRSALQAAAGAVSQRVDGHKALKEGNDRRDQELRGLSERARPGFHLASLLHMLGEATPPEVSLRALVLTRLETPGAFQFELEGVADNAQRKGVEAMRVLEAALAADPRVASARVQPVETEGVSLGFKLTVVPAGNPTPEPPAEKGGS